MTLREDLYHLVDQLADSELEKARRLLEVLHRDVDDDPVSEEEMAEIRRGAEQVERGEYVTLDELDRDIEWDIQQVKFTVILAKDAAKKLSKLDSKTKTRIRERLRQLAEDLSTPGLASRW